jgi:23S rRNA (guanine2445-N2)-methyltransferase / 23S rRNA (guanine2069-N7)-methyltransferase
MRGTFDVQRDHVDLIRRCVSLLRAGGQLIFSTNLRKFTLDTEGLGGLSQVEAMGGTVPGDFLRDRNVHQCWVIRR